MSTYYPRLISDSPNATTPSHAPFVAYPLSSLVAKVRRERGDPGSSVSLWFSRLVGLLECLLHCSFEGALARCFGLSSFILKLEILIAGLLVECHDACVFGGKEVNPWSEELSLTLPLRPLRPSYLAAGWWRRWIGAVGVFVAGILLAILVDPVDRLDHVSSP